MKKKLLSFLSLTAIAILAFAATQASRRAGDPEVLWSSETPVDVNWGWNIAIPVEKCANVAVGDVIDVTVAAINSTEQEWSTQITLCDEDKKAITETYNIGKQTAPFVASFPVTGDMYKYIKENGFRLGGGNCTISKVELRKEVYKGSENSIWIGSATESNITIDLVHLVKAGIKKGDIIRVTLDATDWTQDVSGWVKLQYIKGESYTWTPFEESDLKTINRYDKTPVDFVLLTDAPATILKDVTNNHGLVVQGGSKTTITQVEVLTGYTVNIATGIENGTIKTDKDYAAEGDEVTITATPNDGYELDAISVTGVTSDLAVTVKDGKFTMPADAVTVNATFKKAPVDVVIKASDITGGDITAAIATAAADAPVKNLTINLAAGAYTVSAPIEAAANVIITGAAGAVIDASGNTTGAFIQMSKTPAVKANAKNFYEVDKLGISNVTIKGINTYLYDDSKTAYAFADYSVENCVLEFNTNTDDFINAPFRFQAGGPLKFSLKNNTLYGVGSKGFKYFVKIDSGNFPDKAYETFDGPYTWELVGNTFYKVLASTYQFLNGGRIGNNYKKTALTIQKNIFADCLTGDGFLQNLYGGKRTDTDRAAFVALVEGLNTYIADGKIIDMSKWEKSGTALTTDPYFKDAANGDFAIASNSAQAKAEGGQTGDARWGTWDAGYAIIVGECTGGTVKADKSYAAAGEKVYPTFTPSAGYSSSGIVPIIKNDAGEDVTKDITFGEDGDVPYLIMPAFNITVSVVFQPLPKFYIIGDMNGWDRTKMIEMTYNAETEKYEYEFAPTTTVYFAFSDKQYTAEEAAADDKWNDFNSNHRYALGESDVEATLNETKSLSKVNGTIVLKKVKEGTTYKIIVEEDFNAVTIEGEAAPVLPYVVAGDNTTLFGTAWDASNEANAMTLNTETGKYEITYSNVALPAGNIEYKIVKDGSTWLPADNLILNIPAAGTYDVTFTIDPATNEITAEATVPTGINGIYVDGEAADIFSDGKPVYNLSGQRVFKGYKGVVIKNGKKIVVK